MKGIMADQAKRFEIVILRPLQILFLVSAVVFLFNGMWLWFAGCVLGLIYLGIVGSKLHPLQSASDIAKGPLEGPSAFIESESLPPEVKQALVGHACTRVGILVALTIGMILWAALGWRWYFALLLVWVTILFTGALLKLAFRPS
jgi:hypothetical protein